MLDLEFYKKRYMEYCTANRKLAPCTVRRYKNDLSSFILFLEKLDPPAARWDQVKRKNLDGYLDSISRDYAVSTIKGKFSSLRIFFHFLEDNGVILDNPFKRFRLRIKEPVRLPCALTLGEVNAILAQAYGSENPNAFQKLRDILVLELLFSGGMRVAELCDITHSRCNTVEKTLEVIGKGSRDRLIFITNKEVLSLLQEYLAVLSTLNTNSSSLLLSDRLLPLRPAHVRQIITKYVLAAGINKTVTPHTFRHTFASLLLEEGVGIKYIQEFLGHSSIKTTQIYLHTTSGRKREILSEMHPRKRLGPK